MKYLLNSILETINKPISIILFLLFNFIKLPISSAIYKSQMGGITILGLAICLLVIDSWLTAGIYSLAWNNLNNKHESFSAEANKYFSHILGITIIIGILTGLSQLSITFLHKMTFVPDIESAVYGKRLDAIIINVIPEILITIALIYAIPAVIVANKTGKQAFSGAWATLKRNFIKSKSIIVIVVLSISTGTILNYSTIKFEYASTEYWIISSTNILFSSGISFIVFLTAAQIYKFSTTKNDGHITIQ